jgi:hypothetical protein
MPRVLVVYHSRTRNTAKMLMPWPSAPDLPEPRPC